MKRIDFGPIQVVHTQAVTAPVENMYLTDEQVLSVGSPVFEWCSFRSGPGILEDLNTYPPS